MTNNYNIIGGRIEAKGQTITNETLTDELAEKLLKQPGMERTIIRTGKAEKEDSKKKQ